jgi:hypothetical protein
VAVVAAVACVAVGGVAVFSQMQGGGIGQGSASPTSTERSGDSTVRLTAGTTPLPVAPPTARIGEAVPLVDQNGDDLGSVVVLQFERSSMDPRIVAARVRYNAAASMRYSKGDWVLHDAGKLQYEPYFGDGPGQDLSTGRLAPGNSAEGWVPFEAPAGSLWLDFRDYDGSIIFSVKVN